MRDIGDLVIGDWVIGENRLFNSPFTKSQFANFLPHSGAGFEFVHAGHVTHGNLNQGRTVFGEAFSDGCAQFFRRMGSKALGAEGVGHFDEIRIVQIGGDHPVAVQVFLHALDITEGIVVKQEGDQTDLMLHGGGEFLYVEHKTAITCH